MDAQVGNPLGVAAAGLNSSGYLADTTADGANTFTVAAADIPKFWAGMIIDIINKSTGATLAASRTVTNITSAGVVTYSGADVAVVAGTHVITLEGAYNVTGKTNFNGGAGPRQPFTGPHFDNVAEMRARLKVISSTLYTDAYLNTMTYNDMVYAIRLNDFAGSIK